MEQQPLRYPRPEHKPGPAGLDAIILAGGLGTRLRSVVQDLPKCMAPVGGHPFLYYLLEYLKKQGVRRVILSLGYLHETVEEWIAKPRLFPDSNSSTRSKANRWAPEARSSRPWHRPLETKS